MRRTLKKGLICLSIVAIVLFCTLNVATASKGNYSATFHNARYKGDHILMAGGSTPNSIVYVGSDDGNLYALDASTGAKVWNFTAGGLLKSVTSPAVANGIVYTGGGITDYNLYVTLNAENRDEGVELH